MSRGTGSAFCDKRTGRLYAVVSIGKGDRIGKPCPSAVDLDEARRRATIAAELVNALRDAHRDSRSLLETTVNECATVPLDKLDDVRTMVRALIGSGTPETPTATPTTPRGGRTYGDIAKLWTSG